MLAAVRVLWLIFPFVALALLATLKLPMPLHGDTAMFFAASRLLDDGGVLYRDFWDFKQPGVYWFFLAAGRLFGFSQLGVRELEATWQLTLAAAMTGCLWRYYDHRWLAGIAPLAGIGTYFAVASEWELTQVEILVALPTFLAAWLLSRAATSASPLLSSLASGLCAGAAVVFKLAVAPIFVAFLLLASTHDVSGWPVRVLARRLLALGAPFAAGVVLVVAAVVVVYAAHGALAEMLWSTFLFPTEVIRQGNGLAPANRLVAGLVWYVAALLPWIVFAAVVVPATLRGREPLLTKLMAAWLVLGVAVILLQRFSWWQYHFLLLFVPTGVLGVRGIDKLVSEWRPAAGAWQTMAVTVLLAVPALGLVANDAAAQLMQVKARLRGDRLSLEDYRRLVSRDYDRAAATSEIIRSRGDQRPIYVFGNPLILVLSGRRQSLPVNGWGWEYNLPQQWRALPGDLARSAPAWVYVSAHYDPILKEKSPQTLGYLHSDFVAERQDAFGTLYRAREKPPGGAPATG
jgi:hypothetical protein